MTLLQIWEKIGVQPLTRNIQAVVYIGDKQYKITKMKYKNGIPLGFEAEEIEWFDVKIKPEEDRWVIVKDKDGRVFENHQWKGHAWYDYIVYEDGADGYRSRIDIVAWKYDNRKK